MHFSILTFCLFEKAACEPGSSQSAECRGEWGAVRLETVLLYRRDHVLCGRIAVSIATATAAYLGCFQFGAITEKASHYKQDICVEGLGFAWGATWAGLRPGCCVKKGEGSGRTGGAQGETGRRLLQGPAQLCGGPDQGLSS